MAELGQLCMSPASVGNQQTLGYFEL